MKSEKEILEKIKSLESHKDFFQKKIDNLKYLGRYKEAEKMYQIEIVMINEIINHLGWVLG